MLTTLNFSYHFQLMLFQKMFFSCKILYPTFLHGWPQTFYLTTLLKLNFFSLDLQHNFLKFTIPLLQFLQILQQYNLFLLLEILVWFGAHPPPHTPPLFGENKLFVLPHYFLNPVTDLAPRAGSHQCHPRPSICNLCYINTLHFKIFVDCQENIIRLY